MAVKTKAKATKSAKAKPAAARKAKPKVAAKKAVHQKAQNIAEADQTTEEQPVITAKPAESIANGHDFHDSDVIASYENLAAPFTQMVCYVDR